MFSDTITVFNGCSGSDDAVIWYAHVIPAVHLETSRAQIIKKYGPECTDNAELYIHYTEINGQKTVSGSRSQLIFLSPKEWATQSGTDLSKTLTFGNDDFFMFGEWDGASVVSDSSYTDRLNEGFYSYLNRTKDHVYKITSYGEYSLIPHFEILGR